MSTAQDPKYRNKIFLETYLDPANITKDDSTPLAILVAYAYPNYPIVRVFLDMEIDAVIAVLEPNSTPLIGADHYAYGYEEHVPIIVFLIDKPGLTAAKVKWKIEAELRRVLETYPLGSLRCLERRSDNDQRFGSTTLYSTEFILRYVRDTT